MIPGRMTITELAAIRSAFPKNTVIELLSMYDCYSSLPHGIRGTVECVDDGGTVHINWSNGSSLGVIAGLDDIRRLPDGLLLSTLIDQIDPETRQFRRKLLLLEVQKMEKHITKLCPNCGKQYSGYPAVSRVGLGDICSRCGKVEAFEALGWDETKIQRIVDSIEAQEAEIRARIDRENEEIMVTKENDKI